VNPRRVALRGGVARRVDSQNVADADVHEVAGDPRPSDVLAVRDASGAAAVAPGVPVQRGDS